MSRVQIIERARQNHLFELFRSQVQSLTPELLATVVDSWKSYVRTRVSKAVPENVKAVEGAEETAWSQISELYQQPEWKQECLKRDEKFDMYYTSAVSPYFDNKIYARSEIFPFKATHIGLNKHRSR